MHLSFRLVFMLSVLSFVLATACKSDTKSDSQVEQPVKPEVVKRSIPVPAFSSDSAYAHVAAQVAFGPRVPNSEAHANTRAYLETVLKRYGAEVIVQDFPVKFFDGNRATGYNIIGTFNASAKKRIFLCAHYDTRPFADSDLSTERRDEPILGADDGGSGVGVILEIARLLGQNGFEEMGVDLVLFDVEDYGKPNGSSREDAYTWALGSQYWSAQPHVNGYAPKYGILLDMVGAEGAVFGREQFSKQYAPDVQNKVWNLAKAMGRGARFVNANIGAATDDHYFINTIAGFPTIDVIYKPIGTSIGFGEHWHTHNDNMDVISKETLQDVGQVMTAVIYKEAGNML